MTIKAILFDHDGTLVDSEASHFQMWERILAVHGIGLTFQEYIQGYAGFPSTDNAQKMISKYPELKMTVDDLISAKVLATTKYLSKTAFPLMDGARESIEFFSNLGLKLAVVTGAGREGVSATISAHRLEKYFSTFVSSDDVVDSKPAPDCYLLAAKRLGIDPAECIAIEDTESGVAAADAAGIQCVSVSNLVSGQHDYSKAVAVCANLNSASQWISNKLVFPGNNAIGNGGTDCEKLE